MNNTAERIHNVLSFAQLPQLQVVENNLKDNNFKPKNASNNLVSLENTRSLSVIPANPANGIVLTQEDKVLKLIDQLSTSLEKAKDISDIIEINRNSNIIEVLAKKLSHSIEISNRAAEYKLRCQRKIGNWIEENIRQGGDRSKSNYPTLKDIGLTKYHSSSYKKVAKVPKAVFEDYLETQISNNKEISTKELLKQGKEQEKKQYRNYLKKLSEEYKETDSISMLNKDINNITSSDIKDNSIDLILTDPPYSAEYLNLWDDLGILAKRVLKPGGFLVSYSGHNYLDIVIGTLAKHLSFYSVASALHKRNKLSSPDFSTNIMHAFKPILIFTKGPKNKLSEVFIDVLEADGMEKDCHDWQQSLGQTKRIIEVFSKPNDLILDPFMGSGTTLIAAQELNRRAIGVEINFEEFKNAKGRMVDHFKTNKKP